MGFMELRAGTVDFRVPRLPIFLTVSTTQILNVHGFQMAPEVKRQLITKRKDKVSHFYFYFCQKMEFRTYFFYFHTFFYKFKIQRTSTEFGLPVL